MSPREAVIDLDRLPPEPEDAPPPRLRIPRRHLLVAGALAVALLVPGGAAAPGNPLVAPARTVWIAPEANYDALGDTLYTVESQGSGGPRMTAYPLAGGAPRWTTRLPIEPGNVYLEEFGPLILVGRAAAEPAGVGTLAVDRATGRVRWQSPLPLTVADPGHHRLLLGWLQPTQDVGSAPAGDVASVSPDTGRPIWTYHRDHGCLADLPEGSADQGGSLVVLCADGAFRQVDLDSGEVRRTGTFPVLAAAAASGFGLRMTALRSLVVVNYAVPGRMVVTALDATGLRAKWTENLEPGAYQIARCGALICIFSSNAIVGLDPATGQTRWRRDAGDDTYPYSDRYLIAQPESARPILIDAVTGRTVVTLPGWFTAFSPELTVPMFYRPDATGRRLWVAVLDTDRSVLRVLGSVPQVDGATAGCGWTVGYLICRTVKDAVQVWRISVPG